MSLTKLTDNLNVIQGLADKPTETASQLKAKFDSAGNTIKNYLNNTLTSEVDTAVGTKANSSDVYTKTEIDTTLGTKANNSDVYTKNEINALVKGNILWTGASLMMGDQSITLNETVSNQNNGIVLIWSPYQNGQAQDWGYIHTFISKYQLQFTGKGVNCQLIHNDFSLVACKYVYIGDSVITGSSDNTSSGIGSGITFNNNAFVLRAVVGL